MCFSLLFYFSSWKLQTKLFIKSEVYLAHHFGGPRSRDYIRQGSFCWCSLSPKSWGGLLRALHAKRARACACVCVSALVSSRLFINPPVFNLGAPPPMTLSNPTHLPMTPPLKPIVGLSVYPLNTTKTKFRHMSFEGTHLNHSTTF